MGLQQVQLMVVIKQSLLMVILESNISNVSNLVSNVGVVVTADVTTGVGTARYNLAAAGYSSSA